MKKIPIQFKNIDKLSGRFDLIFSDTTLDTIEGEFEAASNEESEFMGYRIKANKDCSYLSHHTGRQVMYQITSNDSLTETDRYMFSAVFAIRDGWVFLLHQVGKQP